MMQNINALSLTCHVNTWLDHSGHPTVLHVFEHSCNLINEHREVLSIVTPQIGNGPFNLVLPRLRKSLERLQGGDASQQTSEVFFNHLNVESPISIHEDQLILGNLMISTANAKLWNPRPNWEALHANRESILTQLMSLRGQWSSARSNLIAYSQFSNSLVSNFPIALLKRDIADAKEITSRLAGLGAGLTPAGDDFMLGAMYAMWMIHPTDVARVLAEEIVNIAAP